MSSDAQMEFLHKQAPGVLELQPATLKASSQLYVLSEWDSKTAEGNCMIFSLEIGAEATFLESNLAFSMARTGWILKGPGPKAAPMFCEKKSSAYCCIPICLSQILYIEGRAFKK